MGVKLSRKGRNISAETALTPIWGWDPRERDGPKRGCLCLWATAEVPQMGDSTPNQDPCFLLAGHVMNSPVQPVEYLTPPKQRLSKPVLFKLEEKTSHFSIPQDLTLPQPCPPPFVTDMDPSIGLCNSSSNIHNLILKVTFRFPEIRFSSSPGGCL